MADLHTLIDDGRRANMGGVPRDKCPYIEATDGCRAAWLEGWDDGQRRASAPSTVNTGNMPGG